MRAKEFRGIGAIALLLALAACGAPGTTQAEVGSTTTTTIAVSNDESNDDSGGEESADTVAETVGACENTTLDFWYQTSGPEGLAQIEHVAEMFMEKNDGLEIDVTAITFDDMKVQIPLALDGGSGPDIAYVSPLDQGSGLYASGGHLLDLTDVAAERGWIGDIPEALIEYNNAGGDGQIYGIPFKVQIVGVYYNENVFTELGLEPPATFDEFEQVMADVEAGGYLPVSVGGLSAWPLSHVFEQVLHLTTPIDHIAGLEQLDPNYAYDSPTVIEAAAKVGEWYEAGYLDKDLLSVSYEDANTLFITENAAMNIGGSWAAPEFEAGAEFPVRFFAMPPIDPDRIWNAGGHAGSNNFVIPVYSEHQDCALDFLDYILDDEAQRWIWDQGTLVAYQFAETPEAQTLLQADMYEAQSMTGPGYYIGVVNAEVNDAAWDAIQKVVASDFTADEAMEYVQSVYDEQIELASDD